MLIRIKEKIKELAKVAVVIAEERLGSNKGKLKKEMAIRYIIDQIKIPAFFKPAISLLLSSFIDEAVEFAVKYMEEQ